MYAVIETGGKQYRVQEGDIITIEKLNAAVGDVVTFDKVLVLGEGKDIKVGAPYVGTAVTGTVVENGKGQKVIIFKYKASASMKKDELIAFAKENNIEVDEKATKAVIIETIEAALK